MVEMVSFHRSDERARTDQPGIVTWHSFSSGSHYDAGNLSLGPIIACDEHRLDPGAGFDTHPHARMELISWVLEGTMQHEDDAGRTRLVEAGQAQYQLAGLGIRHSERNASSSEPLHFVQFWLLTDEELPDYDVAEPPLRLTAGEFRVVRGRRRIMPGHVVHIYVAAGEFDVSGQSVGPGDSVRIVDTQLDIAGDGQLLLLTLDGLKSRS